MATEKRCEATNMLITGIDAGEGALFIHSGGYTIRVEVIDWPDEFGPERPNLRWEAVRRLIEGHTDDPMVEGADEGVLDLRKGRAS